jgi:hypothetical protein
MTKKYPQYIYVAQDVQDIWTIYAIMSIYREHFPLTEFFATISSEQNPKNLNKFYNNNTTIIQNFLSTFFNERNFIEEIYRENNLSYQTYFEEILQKEIQKTLSALSSSMHARKPNFSIIYRTLHQNKSLIELLLVQDFIIEAHHFISYLKQTKNFDKAHEISIQSTAQIIRKKLLPIILKTVYEWWGTLSQEVSDSSDDLKNEIIYNILEACLTPIYDYSHRVVNSLEFEEEEKAGVVLYITQIKFYILPFLYRNKHENPHVVLDKLKKNPYLCFDNCPFHSEAQKIAYGKELLVLKSFMTKDDNLNNSKHNEAHWDKFLSFTYTQYIEHLVEVILYPRLKEARPIFEQMYINAKPIDFFRAYLYLFMHKNERDIVNNPLNSTICSSNNALKKLIEASYGDIKNLNEDHGKNQYITSGDIGLIVQQHPEIKSLLIEFKSLFETDSLGHYQKILVAINWHENNNWTSNNMIPISVDKSEYNHQYRAALAYSYNQFYQLKLTLNPTLNMLGKISAFLFFIKYSDNPDNALYNFIIELYFMHTKSLNLQDYYQFFHGFFELFTSNEFLGIYPVIIKKIADNDLFFNKIIQHFRSSSHIRIPYILVAIWFAQKFEKLDEFNVHINTGKAEDEYLEQLLDKLINVWEKKIQKKSINFFHSAHYYEEKYLEIQQIIEIIKMNFPEKIVQKSSEKLGWIESKISKFISKNSGNLPLLENIAQNDSHDLHC